MGVSKVNKLLLLRLVFSSWQWTAPDSFEWESCIGWFRCLHLVVVDPWWLGTQPGTQCYHRSFQHFLSLLSDKTTFGGTRVKMTFGVLKGHARQTKPNQFNYTCQSLVAALELGIVTFQYLGMGIACTLALYINILSRNMFEGKCDIRCILLSSCLFVETSCDQFVTNKISGLVSLARDKRRRE